MTRTAEAWNTFKSIMEAKGTPEPFIEDMYRAFRLGIDTSRSRKSKTGKLDIDRRYTKTEIATMKKMAKQGKSRAKIAEALGRSRGSINGTCAYYGIKTNGGSGGTPSHRVRVQTAGLQSS